MVALVSSPGLFAFGPNPVNTDISSCCNETIHLAKKEESKNPHKARFGESKP